MTNAQQWLDQNYPLESRASVTQLALQGKGLEGEIKLTDFVNLERLWLNNNQLTKVDLSKCSKLIYFSLNENPFQESPLTFLTSWKTEIKRLKEQLAEYESDTASQTSTESSYSDLEAKIRAKEAQLNNLRDTGRRSTAPLRKEIELLKKLLGAENKVRELERKEQEYQRQLREKDQAIQSKQAEINQLNNALNSSTAGQELTSLRREKEELERQITNLTAEKNALQERMIGERQEALRGWEREKTQLQSNIAQLKEQKDTFQKSADYLRETLKSAEKSLEEIKTELTQEQEKVKELEKTQETEKESHQTELKNRSEAYGVLSERNQELTKKLSLAEQENSQLGEWISKLESVSGEGNALELLRKELVQAQDTIADLTEQLTSKKPKSYWWVWVVLVLVGLYFLMS